MGEGGAKRDEVPTATNQSGKRFELRIQDDSNSPRIQRNDTVIFREQKNVENGKVAVVLIKDRGIVIRRIVRHKNGLILVPSNAAYSTQFYTNDEIKDLSILILGRVTEIKAWVR